jgi:hypothetical protein
MKNTRKKMLLSSIAMLLVALIALGSATFAWYFDTTQVTATDASLKAAASSGLEISKSASSGYSNTIALDKKADGVAPASLDYAAKLGSLHYVTGGKGVAYDNGELTGNATSSTTASGDFLVNTFYVRSTNSSTPTVYYQIDNVNAPAGTYINFAIYRDGNLIDVYSSSSSGCKKMNITGNTATEGDEQTVKKLTTGTDAVVNDSFAAPAHSANGMKFDVIAFVDGTNPDCNSKDVNLSALEYSFTFSTTALS